MYIREVVVDYHGTDPNIGEHVYQSFELSAREKEYLESQDKIEGVLRALGEIGFNYSIENGPEHVDSQQSWSDEDRAKNMQSVTVKIDSENVITIEPGEYVFDGIERGADFVVTAQILEKSDEKENAS